MPDPARRKKDLTLGAALMFVAAFLVAVITADLPPSDGAPIIILVIAWFLLTLLINSRPLWRYFFGKSAADESEGGRAPLVRAPGQQSLPPARAVPASDFAGRQFETGEVAPPPSVAERTTNLLGEK